MTPDEEIEQARRRWDSDIGNEALARRYHRVLQRSAKFDKLPLLDTKSPRFPSRFDSYLLHHILNRNSSTQPLLAYDYDSEELVVFRWLRHEAFSLEERRGLNDFMAAFGEWMAQSKNIGRVLGPKKWGSLGQRPYYTVSFLPWKNLGQHLQGSKLSLSESLRILRELLKILEDAHSEDVVHQQLSMKSVLIFDEEIRIQGFEKWRLYDQRQRWGQSGAILAPLAQVLSPEQIRGQDTDKSTDVYQLGLIMYQLLTGRHPFQDFFGTPFRVLTQEILKGPRDPRDFAKDLSPELSKICMQALREEARGRYSSMTDFRRALEAAT